MSSQGFGVNPGKTFTTTDLPLPVGVGSVGKTPDGTWMFVQASGAIDQYAAVVISDDGQAAMVNQTNDTVNNLQVGIAQVAAANDEYLWVFVGGVGGGGVGSGIRVKAAASYAADANLYTTTTDGVLDDDTGSPAVLVKNVVGLTTLTGAGTVEVKTTGYMSVN